jgi:hypothetical protein
MNRKSRLAFTLQQLTEAIGSVYIASDAAKGLKKPSRPKLWQNKQTSLLSHEDTPDHWCFAYPLGLTAEESMKREIIDAECSLAEIIEEILEFSAHLEGETPAVDSYPKAVELYSKIIHLKFSLPERLRAEDALHATAIILQ